MLKDDIINNVLTMMTDTLTDKQLIKLKMSMEMALYKYNISKEVTDLVVLDGTETNEKAMLAFLTDCKVQGLARTTIENYKRETCKFLEYVNKSYKDVIKEDVQIYLYRKSFDVSNTTLDNIRKQIKAFFDWAVKNDHLGKSPFINIKPIKRDNVKKNVLSETEIVCLRDACNTRKERAVIDFFLSTGVRVSEVVNLKMEDINFNDGSVTIYAMKTNTYRTVYLDARALKHIVDYRQYLDEKGITSEYVFCRSKGRKDNREGMSKSTYEKIVRNVAYRAGINRRITVHVFRKTLATRLHKKKMSEIYIANILGHKDFSTTIRYYLKIDENDIKNEYMKLIG